MAGTPEVWSYWRVIRRSCKIKNRGQHSGRISLKSQFLFRSQPLIDLRDLITRPDASWSLRILRAFLGVLAVPYWLGAQAKNWVYDLGIKKPSRSSLPTISVGNLSVGGTGKTPVVAWLAKQIRARDIRVAILSRGYGKLDHGQNDEALELELLLPDVPHLQHWDRVESARIAEEEFDMQCLLLDDGFQHRRMGRDLDIVLLDATDPASARHVLPRGLFREPLGALKRAQFVMLTRTDQAVPAELERLRSQITRFAPDALVIDCQHQPKRLRTGGCQVEDLSALQGCNVLAFCAVGNPHSFFRSVEQLGGRLLAKRTWPDHHGYSRDDLAVLADWVKAYPQAERLICTMKDWVKIQVAQIGGVPLAALQIELNLDANHQRQLIEQLEKIIAREMSAPDAPNETG